MDFDWFVLEQIQTLRSPIGDALMPFFSFLAYGGWIWIVLCIVLLIIPSTRRAGVILLVAIGLDLLIVNLGLKPMRGRQRPYVLNPEHPMIVGPESDFSFPSGHTAISFTAASSLFFSRNKLWIPALILAVIIAFSRLYLYVHFPTDVLAGAAIGILCGFLSLLIVNRFWRMEPPNVPS